MSHRYKAFTHSTGQHFNSEISAPPLCSDLCRACFRLPLLGRSGFRGLWGCMPELVGWYVSWSD